MFNFLSATKADGKRLVVALGLLEDSDVPYRRAFESMLEFGGQRPDYIEYLSWEASQSLLMKRGGISCTVKTVP